MLSSSEIRRRFLDFFAAREHRVVRSAPLVPEGDPTLLFTNAGMVQFKGTFLGHEHRPYRRATSAQKCMRVSGKHNDLENVGRTPRHHTFFEMLGNFSFGDYGKALAIEFAWECLTQEFAIPAEHLVASVFLEDDEAYEIWRQRVGLAPERIFRLDEAENFWAMGDTGPCGPCSEIYYDSQPGVDVAAGNPATDSGRFLEIWNLVFMQYERDESGGRRPLPAPCVDTGAGLERLAAVLQGVPSNYETDLFQGILQRAATVADIAVGESAEWDVSLRVIADHARAATFLLGDGVLPSNEGRGYVLRRILRRAARHGALLGLEEPFLSRIAEVVVDEMGPVYPELVEQRKAIGAQIQHEEERFLTTLSKGLTLLREEVRRAVAAGSRGLPGDVVFRLYDTYGFPVDLTEDILHSAGLGYDRGGFDAAMEAQRQRARAAWKGRGDDTADYGMLAAHNAATATVRFVGYDALEATAEIVALLAGGGTTPVAREGERVELIAAQTPFYPEGGGQIGDHGIVETATGRFAVDDTAAPAPGVIVHRGTVQRGELLVGQEATLRVDAPRRLAAARHHSGTHLLHAALREVLGPGATQRGSLVTPERLRFDFGCDGPLPTEQLDQVEDLANRWIAEDAPATIETLPYTDALAAGALAMFGEKYGDDVRTIRFGSFSHELCGGTHTARSGGIGLLKIVSESGVAAGVRRVEALTGPECLTRWRRERRTLERSAEQLRIPVEELDARVAKLLEERRGLQRELEAIRTEQRATASCDLLSQVTEVGDVRVLAERIEDTQGASLRELMDEVLEKLGSGITLLATIRGGKVSLALGVTPDLLNRFHAGALIRETAATLGGRGGGRHEFAQAGGRYPEKLDSAFARLRELVARGRFS